MTPDWTPPPPPLTPAENAVVWIDGMVELFGDGEALANLLNGTIIHPATYARIRDTYPATAKALGISPPLRCPFCDPPTREDVLAWDAGMRATPIALPPPMMACAKHAPMLQTPFATRYPIPTCKEHGEPWCNCCTLRAFQGDAVRICGAPVTTDARGTSTCARPSGHAGFHQLAGFTDEEGEGTAAHRSARAFAQDRVTAGVLSRDEAERRAHEAVRTGVVPPGFLCVRCEKPFEIGDAICATRDGLAHSECA